LRYKNSWRNELSATLANLESLTEGNKALEDRVSQSEVRSPSKGIVKRLFVNTVGAVVMPGGAIAEVVSEEDELVVEAKLSPTDRAFVKPGQNVVVKFTAYEYAIYGGLDGVVEYISPDTIVDERGNTFYTVRVKTTKTTLGDNRPIIPGMIAQVDVITGRKTVLSYILKPLFRAKEKALREH
jgi:adhesin transport system membrane fusion protein